MRWLRRERDWIGLMMIWGLLLQSLVIPVSTTAHAAMMATGSESASIICAPRSASPVPAGTFAPDEQNHSHNGIDCTCCHINCRHGCGGACGAVLGAFAYLVTPRSTALSAVPVSTAQAVYDATLLAQGQPRAPPLA